MSERPAFHSRPGESRNRGRYYRESPEQRINDLCREHAVRMNGALPFDEKLARIVEVIAAYDASPTTQSLPPSWSTEAVKSFRTCIGELVSNFQVQRTPLITRILNRKPSSLAARPVAPMQQASTEQPSNGRATQDPAEFIREYRLDAAAFREHFDDSLRTLIIGCWPHINPETLFARKHLHGAEPPPVDAAFIHVVCQIRTLLEPLDSHLVQRFDGTFAFSSADLLIQKHDPLPKPIPQPAVQTVVTQTAKRPVAVTPITKPALVTMPVVPIKAPVASVVPATSENVESINNPLEDQILSVLKQLCPEVDIEKFHRRKTMRSMTTAYMARASLPFQKSMGALYLALADIPGAQKYLCDTFNFNPAQIRFWGETGDRLLPWEYVRNADGHPFSLDAHVIEHISDNLVLRRYEFMRRLGGDPNRNESVRLLSPEIKLQIGELCRKLINTPGAIDRFCEMFDIPKQDALNLMEQTPTPSAPAA